MRLFVKLAKQIYIIVHSHTCYEKGGKRRVYQQDFMAGILTLNCGSLVLTKDRNINDCTCKFSTIVVEKDEYRDGHHEPDQKPPVFSFLVACLKNTTIPRIFKLSFHWIFNINLLPKISYIWYKVDNLLTISLSYLLAKLKSKQYNDRMVANSCHWKVAHEKAFKQTVCNHNTCTWLTQTLLWQTLPNFHVLKRTKVWFKRCIVNERNLIA